MPKYRTVTPHYLKIKGQEISVYVDADTEVGAGTPFDFEGPPSMAMLPLNDAAKVETKKIETKRDAIASLPIRGDPVVPTAMPATAGPAAAPGQPLLRSDKK